MIGGKTAATVAFAAMLAATAAVNLPGRGDAARDKVVCTDFATFDEAQKALLDNAKNAVTLDPDGNGIACEEVFPAESAAAAAATATAEAAPTNAAPAGNAERKAARQATATAGAASTEAAQTPTPTTEQQGAKAGKKTDRQTATAAAAASGGNADKKAARQATATAAAAGEAPKKNQKKTPTPEAALPTPVGGDLDCIDFAFQEDAQAVLDQNPKDPYNLDPNHDGIACSSLPRRGGPIVALPATGSGPAPLDGWPVHAGL